jgi:hypothetical protein
MVLLVTDHFFQQLHLSLDGHRSKTENLLELCKNLRAVTFKPMNSIKISGSWCPRALMIGRRGSGADVQALLLAKEFGLILGQCISFLTITTETSTTHCYSEC